MIYINVPGTARAQGARGHAYAQGLMRGMPCHRWRLHLPLLKTPVILGHRQPGGLDGGDLFSGLRDAHNYPVDMELQLDSSKVDDLVTYMLTLSDSKYRPPS